MLAVVLILYTALAAEFLIRFNLDRPTRRSRKSGVIFLRGVVDKSMKCMLIGMSAMAILLLIRSIYRAIELSGGWNGKVVSTQWLFSTSFMPRPHPFHVWNPEVLMIKQTCLTVPWSLWGCLCSVYAHSVPPWGAVVWT